MRLTLALIRRRTNALLPKLFCLPLRCRSTEDRLDNKFSPEFNPPGVKSKKKTRFKVHTLTNVLMQLESHYGHDARGWALFTELSRESSTVIFALPSKGKRISTADNVAAAILESRRSAVARFLPRPFLSRRIWSRVTC